MPGDSTLKITIGGVDYTDHVDLETVKLTNNLSVGMDIAEFTVFIAGQSVARPKGGSELVITDQLGRAFAGVVSIVTEVQDAVIDQLDYQVQAKDFSYHLNRKLSVDEYAANVYTYGQIVADLISKYGAPYGITSGGVQSAFLSEYQRFDYLPVDQCLSLLAQKISWTWYVDYSKVCQFFPAEQNPSPLPGNALQVDTAATQPDATYGSLGVYGDLQLAEDVSQMKTRVFLHGQKVTVDYTYDQKWTGDGSTKTFGLAYEPSHDAANVTVTVGGQQYAVETDIASGSPSNATQDYVAYINYENLLMRFNVAPANGVTVEIVYRPMVNLTVMVNDPSKERAMAARTGDDGIFEYAISDPSLSADTIDPAKTRGQFTIAKYGAPHLSGQFVSFLPGWRAGQAFTLRSSKRMGGDFDGVTMYVNKVDRRLVSHPATKDPLFQSTVYFADSLWVF